MTTAIKRRRGTTAQHATFTGLEGELTIDTTKDTVVVHDGATAGGFPLAKESQVTNNVNITGGSVSGITDLAIADGGTGASDAATARTNLGLAIGTNVQAYDADLTAIAALAPTADNFIVGNGTAWTLETPAQTRTSLGLGTAATTAASDYLTAANPSYTGTLTGGTGVVNLGSGQVYKDASGNVGIGTSSPFSAAGWKALSIDGTSQSLLDLRVGGVSTGYLYAQGTSVFLVNNTATGATVFQTNSAERMRIDSSGNLLVGQTSLGLTTTRSFSWQGAGDGAFSISHSTSNGNGDHFIRFGYNGTSIGTISQANTTGVLYNVTSDYRLKTIVSNVKDSGERIDALEPIEYDWNNGGGRTRGFLAHQFAEVYPNSVSGKKDAVDKNGNPIYQGMQASTPEVMADLIAEIQSLRKRVALLESK